MKTPQTVIGSAILWAGTRTWDYGIQIRQWNLGQFLIEQMHYFVKL